MVRPEPRRAVDRPGDFAADPGYLTQRHKGTKEEPGGIVLSEILVPSCEVLSIQERDSGFRLSGLHLRVGTLLLGLHLGEKRVDRLVHRLTANAAVTDDTLVVEHVDGRPAADVPAGGDRTRYLLGGSSV